MLLRFADNMVSITQPFKSKIGNPENYLTPLDVTIIFTTERFELLIPIQNE